MNKIKSNERGYFDFGWLKTRHSFSFGEYYDPSRMGYRSLRVINEDFIEKGAGFPTHGHRDMEIITYVVSGALEHKDSTGNNTVIRPGEVQRMTAGSGIRHSEYNHLQNEDAHILQIWILPTDRDLEPGYEQKDFSEAFKQPGLHLVASKDGREGSVTIHQDANIYVGQFRDGKSFEISRKPKRGFWIQVVKGSGRFNGEELSAGDALQLEDDLKLEAAQNLEFLLFDLA